MLKKTTPMGQFGEIIVWDQMCVLFILRVHPSTSELLTPLGISSHNPFKVSFNEAEENLH
jgi:hypothetical protein